MRSPTLAATLLALTCACGTHETHSASYHFIDSDAGGVTVEEAGVSIVIVDVPYRASSTTVNGRTNGSRALLGHPFGLSDGHFYIGPVNYGPAPAGSKIQVARDGVTIDGERRGDVPPAITESIDDTAEEE